MAIQALYPEVRPSLNLDFANTKRLDPRITFARASSARYYDGKTVAKAEENLLLQSQNFTTSWSGINLTRTANTEAAPDGTTTANTLDDGASAGVHAASQSPTLIANTSYTISIFAKNVDRDFVGITVIGGASNYASAEFDISTGTVNRTNESGTGWSVSSTSIVETSAGSGWYRCVMTLTTGTTVTGPLARIYLSDGTSTFDNRGQPEYTGTSKTVLAWGAQLEQRSALTAYQVTTTQPITNYIPTLLTATDNVARFDHNPTTGESLGLLVEEQRSNLLTYSEQFDNAAWSPVRSSITANTIVAPNGTLTGDKLVEDTTANNSHSVIRASSVTIVANAAYTASAFIKAGERTRCSVNIFNSAFTSGARGVVNLSDGTIATETIGSATSVSGSITPVGNNWYRCSITAIVDNSSTAAQVQISLRDSSNNATYTGDGYSGIYIWGAQLE